MMTSSPSWSIISSSNFTPLVYLLMWESKMPWTTWTSNKLRLHCVIYRYTLLLISDRNMKDGICSNWLFVWLFIDLISSSFTEYWTHFSEIISSFLAKWNLFYLFFSLLLCLAARCIKDIFFPSIQFHFKNIFVEVV